MEEKTVIKIVLQAMAEKIDRLRGELFCKDFEIEKLKAENEKLKLAVENLKKAFIKGEA